MEARKARILIFSICSFHQPCNVPRDKDRDELFEESGVGP